MRRLRASTFALPGLPGCVTAGATVQETELTIPDAIEFHLEGMKEAGVAIPSPESRVEFVELTA